MKQLYRSVILTLVVCLCSLISRASSVNQETMCYLTQETGLAGLTAKKIITDHTGQIWIATSSGVNRYNGKVLINIPFAKGSRLPNFIFDLSEGDDHAIYVVKDDGVWRLSEKERAFKRIISDVSKPKNVIQSSQALYVGASDGLHIYFKDGRKKTIQLGDSPMSRERNICQLCRDKQGRIWFLTHGLLSVYSPKTGRCVSYPVTRGEVGDAGLSQFALYKDKVYLGTKNNGLFVWNFKTRRSVKVPGIDNIINSLCASKDGKLAVGTDGDGAYLVDAASGSILNHFTDQEGSPRQLASNSVYYYYHDDNGVDWFGFYHYGLAYTYYSDALFHPYRLGTFNTIGVQITCMYVHGDMRFIGSTNGLYIINEKTGTIGYLDNKALLGANLITAIIFYKGSYYIGSYDGGLRKLAPGSWIVSKDGLMPMLSNATIGSLAVAPNGRLCIGSNLGLFITDGQKQATRLTEDNASIIGGCISDICFLSNHIGWFVGRTGLCIYLPETQSFAKTNFPKGFFNTEPITQCSKASNGLIYFVGQSGLFYSDEKMHHFGQERLPASIGSEQIVSFLDDRHGHYWIATESGLFCTDYHFRQAVHFGNGEGLNCQFITSRLYLDDRGHVWIGTSNGLVYVSIKDLDKWKYRTKFKTIAYDIQIDGIPVDFTEETAINNHHLMEITWNFVSQELSLALIVEDFARPLGRKFEYKVDDGDWCYLNGSDRLTLSHLCLGNHQLFIRLAGALGTTQTYTLSVRPSFAFWLEMILALLVIAGAFVGKRIYKRRTADLLAERNEMEGVLVEMEEEQQKKDERQALEEDNDSSEKPTATATRMKVDAKEAERILKKLTQLMEKEKLYTNPDLKLGDLAELLGISATKLSTFFCLNLGTSYYEFINNYRLNEFKRLVKEGESSHYTLIALSEKCGFKKSNFFYTFRKVEGMTPNEYLKRNT